MRALILDNGDMSEDISPFFLPALDLLQTPDNCFDNYGNIIIITV